MYSNLESNYWTTQSLALMAPAPGMMILMHADDGRSCLSRCSHHTDDSAFLVEEAAAAVVAASAYHGLSDGSTSRWYSSPP